MKTFFKSFLLTLLIFSVNIAFASESKIFTYEFSQRTNLAVDYKEQSKEYFDNLCLKEAEEFYSAMIYGYNFELIPKHFDRKIPQDCKIHLNKRKIDKSKLNIYQRKFDKGLYSAYIRYDLNPIEENYINIWKKDRSLNGKGKAKISFMEYSKMQSYYKALNIAIIDTIKKSMRYKPKKITGLLLLKEPPRFYYKSGYIVTVVNIDIKIDSIKNFSDF